MLRNGEGKMKDNIKTAVEFATTRFIIRIVEKTIEDVFTKGYDDQKEGIKSLIINMVKGALIDIV